MDTGTISFIKNDINPVVQARLATEGMDIHTSPHTYSQRPYSRVYESHLDFSPLATRALSALVTYAYHRFTANIPSPFTAAINPACRRRFITSLGTSRPLVSLFGVPV